MRWFTFGNPVHWIGFFVLSGLAFVKNKAKINVSFCQIMYWLCFKNLYREEACKKTDCFLLKSTGSEILAKKDCSPAPGGVEIPALGGCCANSH